jgi:hypothetical protein
MVFFGLSVPATRNAASVRSRMRLSELPTISSGDDLRNRD